MKYKRLITKNQQKSIVLYLHQKNIYKQTKYKFMNTG